MKKRQSGVLMHISSLPGKYGIGSFGQSAYDFVDFWFAPSSAIGRFCHWERPVMVTLLISLSLLSRGIPTLSILIF